VQHREYKNVTVLYGAGDRSSAGTCGFGKSISLLRNEDLAKQKILKKKKKKI